MNNILIIGGNSGIGLSLSNKLSKENKVIRTFFKNKPEKEIENIESHHLNVLDEELNLDFIPEKLDGLVYCPGTINLKPFSKFTEEDFINDYKLQFLGAVKIIQAVIKKLRKSNNGSVVLFSSIAVQHGLKFHSQVSSSKAAIEGLTRSLAAEYSPKVRFNCIAPSLTETSLSESLLKTDGQRDLNAKKHPLQRIGQAEDIANMAEFLLSEKSSWISGQVLKVDGGMSSIIL